MTLVAPTDNKASQAGAEASQIKEDSAGNRPMLCYSMGCLSQKHKGFCRISAIVSLNFLKIGFRRPGSGSRCGEFAAKVLLSLGVRGPEHQVQS